MASKEFECLICGKIFLSKANCKAKYCSDECRKEGARRYNEIRRNFAEYERKRMTVQKVIDIANEASRLGLTYGQYVSKLYEGDKTNGSE